MKIPKTKPLRLPGQGLQVQKLKSLCNSPIIGDSGTLLQDFLQSIYLYSGGRDEIETYLLYFGVPEILLELAIAQIEYLAARGKYV